MSKFVKIFILVFFVNLFFIKLTEAITVQDDFVKAKQFLADKSFEKELKLLETCVVQYDNTETSRCIVRVASKGLILKISNKNNQFTNLSKEAQAAILLHEVKHIEFYIDNGYTAQNIYGKFKRAGLFWKNKFNEEALDNKIEPDGYKKEIEIFKKFGVPFTYKDESITQKEINTLITENTLIAVSEKYIKLSEIYYVSKEQITGFEKEISLLEINCDSTLTSLKMYKNSYKGIIPIEWTSRYKELYEQIKEFEKYLKTSKEILHFMRNNNPTYQPPTPPVDPPIPPGNQPSERLINILKVQYSQLKKYYGSFDNGIETYCSTNPGSDGCVNTINGRKKTLTDLITDYKEVPVVVSSGYTEEEKGFVEKYYKKVLAEVGKMDVGYTWNLTTPEAFFNISVAAAPVRISDKKPVVAKKVESSKAPAAPKKVVMAEASKSLQEQMSVAYRKYMSLVSEGKGNSPEGLKAFGEYRRLKAEVDRKSGAR